MPIGYKENLAAFGDTVSVEEAESLLQWIQDHPRAKVDFSHCKHVHAANLQVLMAARVPVAVWPNAEDLKVWLSTALYIG